MHRPALLGKMGNERSSDLYKKQYVGESVANFEPGGRRFESVQARHLNPIATRISAYIVNHK